MESIKNIINFITTPYILFTLAAVLLSLSFVVKKIWNPWCFFTVMGSALALFFFGLQDQNFYKIIGKPDNIPIAGMVFLVGFFTWLSMWQAIENDRRIKKGEKSVEEEDKQKVLVWPDLVYIEFICMIVATILLIIWTIKVEAPLEGPANPTASPNPSKAPWYFLGLQEMLVYYDPWIAGVVLPSLIIFGLMAIPYLDKNPGGNGYYTFAERRFAIIVFLFGFLILWILLIISGTFLRGPNWNFFGPFEYWDIHKLEPLVNVNLSEYFWLTWRNTGLPEHWLVRESLGILLLLLYFIALPVLLAKTWCGERFRRMGAVRYSVMMLLLLMMIGMPVKLYVRWIFNLKYIISIPELLFNI